MASMGPLDGGLIIIIHDSLVALKTVEKSYRMGQAAVEKPKKKKKTKKKKGRGMDEEGEGDGEAEE